MSISSEAKDDIRAAKQVRPPRWALVLFGFACLPVFWLFDHFGSLNLALPMIGSVIAFGFVLYVKRRLWGKWWLWVTVAVVGLLHASVIWLLPWSEDWHPAIIGGLVISVDVCIILWVLATVEALIERRMIR